MKNLVTILFIALSSHLFSQVSIIGTATPFSVPCGSKSMEFNSWNGVQLASPQFGNYGNNDF